MCPRSANSKTGLFKKQLLHFTAAYIVLPHDLVHKFIQPNDLVDSHSIQSSLRATHTIDTPKGNDRRCSHQPSLPKILPSTPLSPPIVILFSEDGRTPVSRINNRPTRIVRKKLMFA